MYPYVIFDLDGTLLNTIDDLANAGNHVCRLHGWPTHSVDEFKRMVGNGIPKLVERFAPEGTGAPVLEQALGEFMAWYGVHKADQTAPYPGMLQAVRRLKEAGSYDEARAVFLEREQAAKHLSTMTNLAHIRHSIDTRDAFYDGEMKFWNAALPELQEYEQAWTQAMLDSPYRTDFSAEYGDLMFVNAEIALKTFSPEIIPQLQQENELTQEYEKLLASAQIPFEGKVYTLSQLTPFKNDPDDGRRLAAWKAEGQWYKDNQDKMDAIYDQLVHLRDEMGRKLGYEGYTTLG